MKNKLTNVIYNWSNQNPDHQVEFCKKTDVCTILYDNKFNVIVEESVNRDHFFLYSVIGQLSDQSNGEIAFELLKSNLFGKETGHSNIGYDEATKSLVLFRKVSLENLTDYSFEDIINEFLAYRYYWDDKFNNLNKASIVDKREKLTNKDQIIYRL